MENKYKKCKSLIFIVIIGVFLILCTFKSISFIKEQAQIDKQRYPNHQTSKPLKIDYFIPKSLIKQKEYVAPGPSPQSYPQPSPTPSWTICQMQKLYLETTCKAMLGYCYIDLSQTEYKKWLAVKNINNMNYEPGHLFERHIAVNNLCTIQQIKGKKTVFLNQIEMEKAIKYSRQRCDIPSQYNFVEQVESTTQFRGLDCSKNPKQQIKFKKAKIVYRKATQQKLNRENYLRSRFTTILTVYPSR